MHTKANYCVDHLSQTKALKEKEEKAEMAEMTAGKLHASGKHLMVSYSWADKAKVIKFCEALGEVGIEVWRDEVGSAYAEKIEGSTVEAMAEAIEKSSIVVCFVSKPYKESANCRLECEYAFRRHQRKKLSIEYVMMDSDYTTVSDDAVEGWLGLMIGQKLWQPYFEDNHVHNLVRLVSAFTVHLLCCFVD